MSTRTAFGLRLRRERERRGLSLEQIAEQSKVSASHFAALERGDLSRWPAGIFGIGFVRSYAQAVGLDPAKTAEEFTRVRGEPDGKSPAAPSSAASPAPASTPVPSAAPINESPDNALRITLDAETTASVEKRLPSLSSQRVVIVLAEAVLLVALATPIWWWRGWTAFWMAMAIAAMAAQLFAALTGTTWLTAIWPRPRPVPAPAVPAAAAQRDKRRSPDARPSQNFRRARRADRRRQQA